MTKLLDQNNIPEVLAGPLGPFVVFAVLVGLEGAVVAASTLVGRAMPAGE